MNTSLLMGWMLEHPNLVLTFQVFWHVWIAGALAVICVEMHSHNTREEKNTFKRQLEEERRR